MDLAALDLAAYSDEGAELVLVHPITGKPLDAKITVIGPDSPRSRQAQRALLDQLMEDRRKGKTPDDIETERRAAAMAAALTIGWSGIEWNGEPLPCTRENVMRVYTERRWVREQVEGFAAERANFFRHADG